uniref:Uncharacterized protein n=1 Tax=viral metagenome TaxID=1070528 RepID=A0A6M3LBY7_9ZZZZ
MEQPVKAILEEGVDFFVTVKKTNILHRLKILKDRKRFVIYPITLGTLFKIAQVLGDLGEKIDLKPDLKDSDFITMGIENIVKHTDKMVKVVAYAILNKNQEPSRGLIKFLEKNLTASEILRLLTLVVQQMDIQDFLACMVSLGQMNLATPKKRTGGRSSEVSSNISDSTKSTSSGESAGKT